MNTTKMVLVPADSQTGGNEIEQPKRIDRNPQKIEKLLKIALKIASKDAYDEDFQIRDQNGNSIINSDITSLLNSAISPQKLLVGEQDFIRLLYETKVDPNWIVNENMRSKLLNFIPSQKPPSSDTQNIPPTPPIPPPSSIPPTISPTSESISPLIEKPNDETHKKVKRKALNGGPVNKKQREIQPWEVPLPEDDDD